MSVKTEFYRGNTDKVEVKDGQLLFDLEKKSISIDAMVEGSVERIDMTPSIESIDDIDIDDQTLADGDILVYDGTSGKWTNGELGSAASIDVPTGGADATASQVVMGNDSRLTDARPASDVPSWAKSETKPTYSASEVGAYTTTQVDNLISALESGLDWKEAVDTFDDIATEYPEPEIGWTVNVIDTNYTYRYDGTEWVAVSANAIPEASSSVSGLMTSTMVDKLDGIESGAEVNVQSDWNESDTESDAYIKNKPNLGSGTITSVRMNGRIIATSGEANLGTVLTSHQDVSDKMSIDGSNAADAVTFGGSFTVGNRAMNSDTGIGSIAMGKSVVASGDYTYAEGHNASALGYYSHAEGDGTVAGLPPTFKHADYFQYCSSTSGIVVFSVDNKVHILGDPYDKILHYTWDGTTWTKLSNLEETFYRTASGDYVIEFNNKIYQFTYSDGIYVYNADSTWTQLPSFDGWSNVRSSFNMVVYNGNIHILGGGLHLVWDGVSATSTQLANTDNFYLSNARVVTVVYNNEIHVFARTNLIDSSRSIHYKWDGSTWSRLSDNVPLYVQKVLVCNGQIYLLTAYKGNSSSSDISKLYKWDATNDKYIYVCELPFGSRANDLLDGFVYDDKIYYVDQSTFYYLDLSIGAACHSEGKETTATGSVSHAEGIGTIAAYEAQHVSGKYNSNKATTLLEIGNGSSASNRSNAFEVYTDGSLSTNNGETKAKLPVIKSATLTVGKTTVSISGLPTSGKNIIEFVTSVPGLEYTGLTVDNGVAVLTYPAQSTAVTVFARVTEITS